jgi:hypothetical protein
VVEPTPLKNMKVSWGDYEPDIWKNENHVPNHQPVLNGFSPNDFGDLL